MSRLLRPRPLIFHCPCHRAQRLPPSTTRHNDRLRRTGLSLPCVRQYCFRHPLATFPVDRLYYHPCNVFTDVTMGCTLSKRNALPPTGFKVYNMDCNGNVKNEGHLEITSCSLVLRFKGNKPSAVWPLSSVRKYGYEDYLFCFEAGRSSPCGQGVFAFKSKKAKQIFDSVKEELLKVNNNSNAAEDISLEIREYSDQASSITNNVFENHGVIQFSSLKYSESNEYIRKPDLIEPDLIEPNLVEPENVLESQISSSVNSSNDKKLINAGIFASDDYHLPPEVLQYTEVEIAICPTRKTDPLPKIPKERPEPSDYNVIDFVQTKNVSQQMFKSTGDISGRKTRHDSTLEDD